MPVDKTNTMQTDFLARLGGNAEAFLSLLDALPDTAAYLKDRKGRIMFLNQWNVANCNVRDAAGAIGKTSYDLFPEACAKDYVLTDNRVMRTGRPASGVSATPDLAAKFMKWSKAPLRGRDGAVIGVAAVYRVIRDAQELPGWYGDLSSAAAYINAHYAEAITVGQLARLSRCSASTFAHAFKRFFKMTPIDYLLLTRVNAARDLLEHTSRLIADIAQAVGFYDQSHFIRTFKRFRSVTPHRYRLRHRRASP